MTTTTTTTIIMLTIISSVNVNYGNKNDDSNDEKVPMGTVLRKPKVSEWQTTFSLQKQSKHTTNKSGQHRC